MTPGTTLKKLSSPSPSFPVLNLTSPQSLDQSFSASALLAFLGEYFLWEVGEGYLCIAEGSAASLASYQLDAGSTPPTLTCDIQKCL